MATPGQLMFARGLQPSTRLILWIVVSAALAFIDVRFGALEALRSGFSQAMGPLQRAVLVPFLNSMRLPQTSELFRALMALPPFWKISRTRIRALPLGTQFIPPRC